MIMVPAIKKTKLLALNNASMEWHNGMWRGKMGKH